MRMEEKIDDLERIVHLDLEFGGTEIKVFGRDLTSGEQTRLVIHLPRGGGSTANSAGHRTLFANHNRMILVSASA